MQSLSRPLKWPPIFPLEKGLVLWLPFDDRSGARALDRSGKGNHGTLYGPTWVAGRRGSALRFDGVDDYVSIPNLSTLFPANIGTIAFWVNHLSSQTGGRGLVLFSGLKPLVYLASNNLQVVWAGASGFPVSNAYTRVYNVIGVRAYHLVAFCWDGVAGTYALYCDGVLLESGTGITLSALTTGVEELGRYAGSNYFNGVIDEVRIYNRALSAAEVKRLYESELLQGRF